MTEVPTGTAEPSTFWVADAPPSVTETIVDRDLPNVPSTDRRRLAQFSRGFPENRDSCRPAFGLNSRPVAYAMDDELVDAFVLGRSREEREPMLQAAAPASGVRSCSHRRSARSPSSARLLTRVPWHDCAVPPRCNRQAHRSGCRPAPREGSRSPASSHRHEAHGAPVARVDP